MCDYAYNRIKNPRVDQITEDSLMKCINDYNIVISGGIN